MVKWRGTKICRRSRCSGVMVSSAVGIHSALHESGRNPTSLSFVAFERSIGADLDPSTNGNELSVRTQVSNGRTREVTGNTEGFEGMRAPFHQRHHQRKIFVVKPRPNELPEVDTAGEG